MAWSSPRNRALHLGRREAQHAEVQAGRWAGASPVRSLSADALRAYEAELLARDVPWQPTEPESLVRVVDVTPVLCGPRNQIAPDEAQEIPVTMTEAARVLLAEIDALSAAQAEKRRAALTLADELQQEAEALREAAGGVALAVKTKAPPKAMSKPKVAPTKPVKRGGNQPHFGKLRPGGLNARIVEMLGGANSDVSWNVTDIAAILREIHRDKVVASACVTLANKGHILRAAPGEYQAVPK